MWIVAVDPGSDNGVAAYHPVDRRWLAATVRWTSRDPRDLWRAFARAFADDGFPPLTDGTRAIYIEVPPPVRSRGVQTLLIKVGAWSDFLASRLNAPVHYVNPSSWRSRYRLGRRHRGVRGWSKALALRLASDVTGGAELDHNAAEALLIAVAYA